METRFLRDLEVSAIGMGCMGFTHAYGEQPSEEEGIRMNEREIGLACGQNSIFRNRTRRKILQFLILTWKLMKCGKSSNLKLAEACSVGGKVFRR